MAAGVPIDDNYTKSEPQTVDVKGEKVPVEAIDELSDNEGGEVGVE